MALPEIGPEGQERIGAATVAVLGDDLAAETAARYLAAAGVKALRLVARRPPAEVLLAALRASNPELAIEHRSWPTDEAVLAATIEGCGAAVRSDADQQGPEAVLAGTLGAAEALHALVAGRDARVISLSPELSLQ